MMDVAHKVKGSLKKLLLDYKDPMAAAAFAAGSSCLPCVDVHSQAGVALSLPDRAWGRSVVG